MSRLPVAMRWQEQEGQPLPPVYPEMAGLRSLFRRGQLAMVAGASGSGKTAWITDYVLSLPFFDPSLKVLIFSADSDRGTVGLRTMASVTQYTMEDVERLLAIGNSKDAYRRLYDATSHIWYCFDSNLTPTSINAELAAYITANGCFPDIIVVDNLIDMRYDDRDGGGMDDYTGHANSVKWLKDLARHTMSAMIVLHHVTGQHADGGEPVPISAILGKIDRHPRLIFTIWRPDDDTMGISVVKNSNGPMDRSGNLGFTLNVDLSRMHFFKGSGQQTHGQH